jgi:hypothetical protein
MQAQRDARSQPRSRVRFFTGVTVKGVVTSQRGVLHELALDFNSPATARINWKQSRLLMQVSARENGRGLGVCVAMGSGFCVFPSARTFPRSDCTH